MRWEVYPKHSKKGGKVYTYYRVRIWQADGSYQTYPLKGCNTLTDAFLAAESMAATGKAPQAGTTLPRLVEQYHRANANEKGARTLREERYTHDLFVAWLQKHHPGLGTIRDIKKDHILEYRTHRRENGAGKATWNRHRAYLSVLWSWAVDHNKADYNLILSVKRSKEDDPVTGQWSVADLDKALAALPGPYLAAAVLQLDSLMRPGELCRFELAHLDADRSEVDIVKTKSGKRRRLSIDPLTVEVLLGSGLRTTGPAFPSRRGDGPLTPRMWTEILQKAARAAGVACPTRPGYAIRHTGANLAAENTPLKNLQYRLGHVVVTTTMRYQHPDTLDRRASQAVGIGDRLKAAGKVDTELTQEKAKKKRAAKTRKPA